MKMNQANSFVQMKKEDLQQLCTEVKETLATENHISNITKHTFSVADLWKIQRHTRYRVQRRNTPF
jgi:hypothetical protein